MMNCPPITYLCKSPGNGDSHWRVVRPSIRLREAGVDTDVCWLDDDMMPTGPVAGRVVVLHQTIVDGGLHAARAWVARLKAAGALAVVYETDDDELTGANIDHLAATHPISASDRAALEARRLARIDTLRACDGATVSTEPLAEVVRRYTDRPVITVPNAIDVDWFRARLAPRAQRADHLTIGWAGWRRPDADLEPMAEAWARIAARYPDVRFVVAGHQADAIYRQDIPLDRIIRLPVAPLDEYPRLHQVDIGCCAVADTPFSRCKSPIKAWEYALAGAVVVGTPTLYGPTINNAILGRFGLLANTADEWESALRWFIEKPGERAWCQRRFSQHVERDLSLRANLHRWADAYREIVASAGRPGEEHLNWCRGCGADRPCESVTACEQGAAERSVKVPVGGR